LRLVNEFRNVHASDLERLAEQEPVEV